MKITDLEGMEIEVKDIDIAIALTTEFIGYTDEDKAYMQFDLKRKAYWEDILNKLEQLKQQKTN